MNDEALGLDANLTLPASSGSFSLDGIPCGFDMPEFVLEGFDLSNVLFFKIILQQFEESVSWFACSHGRRRVNKTN
jgi:hypothetical protein